MMTENSKNYHAPMHTAEHILNQTMIRMFNCERSFNNHIERKKSKCDYHFDRNLTSQEIDEINKRVNEVLNSGLEIKTEILDRNEAINKYKTIKLPEKADEKIRIVKIGDYDICPCSGEHINNTSEAGTFNLTTSSFDNGVLRIRFKVKAQ